MTDWLIRRFVKDSENTGSRAVREAYGVLAGAVGIAANMLLCGVKFLIGVITGSIAVQADAVNNLADIGSNLMTLLSARLAGKPADKEHPYGHARMEYIAALIIAFLILMVGFELGKESFAKILHPEDVEFTVAAMLALAASILVKLWMGMFTANIGRRIDSATMSAATADSLMDCISTGAILVSSVLAYFFGVNLDGYIGLAVAAFVLYSGIKLVKETVSPLMGEAPASEFVKELADRIAAYDGVIDTHDILIHSYGPGNIIATAHAEVDAKGNVLELHELVDRIELEVGREMGMLLTIHMDPVELDNPNVRRAKEVISGIISELPVKTVFHDFRMVPGEKRNNLIFDLVMPLEIGEAKENEILDIICRKAKEADSTYACVIQIDHDFSGLIQP